jgi:tRNA A-37 threonylcarbamoyl transferase component Bud32
MPAIEKLGKYEIRREIGRGAMGVVYEGYDPMIKRAVAIKTIRADQLAKEEAGDILARFRREAQAAGRLTHPNIVAIYDFDEDAGTSFIAMEYVEGRDLRDYFAANERFAAKDAFRVMGEILAALEYSHARGVVHRDIKPANVFLQRDGTVKVADFGIAHIESSSLTQAGTVMGTPGYMSPEQVLGLPVDGRSDLFSAGVILYQFLTGERPFSGSATTTAQKVLKEDPLPPSTLNVQLPDAIDAVVRKALAKKPEERFQTAAEFAAALRAAAGHRATSAPLPAASTAMDAATEVHVPSAAPGTVVRAAGAPVAAPAPAAQQAPAYAKPKSQATAIAVVGAVVVAAVAVGMWTWLQRPSAPASVAASSAPPPAAPPAAAVSAAAVPVAPSTTPAPVETAPAVSVSPAPKPAPGTMVITAVGVADPANPRYQGDAALLQQDLRADANGQLVQKALGLMVEPSSLAKNYDVLNDRLVTKSSGFVGNVVREGAPSTGKSGLVTLTTEAVVDVKAVQKSLNEMSRKERIQLIRAGGDPRIALKVSVRDADAPSAAPRASPAAENLLKDRIRSFGFRTWSDTAEPGQVADFLVTGEARVRRLTTRLEASGITVTKYAVAALSVKCVDRATGEEIYYNTTLPKGTGSWATEEEALRAVGGKMADEFSRDFFLAHVNPASRRVALVVDGLPEGTADVVGREFASLPAVIAAKPRADGARRIWDLELGGSGSATDRLAAGVFAPLNRKLGQSCFATAGSEGDEVRATFDARCTDPAVLSRLETHPPAGLYAAPPGRTSGVVKNPDTLRKLSL